jgi:prepilin-type N-terminal cleavage/methylation domain-containing protein
MDRWQDMTRRHGPPPGFTLIEILIVVAIIGMLLAVAVPSWIKTRERAQRDICIENLLQLETAKQLWALETGKGTGTEPGDEELIGPQLYLKTLPLCPAGGEYDINPVGVLAECTIDNHQLDP